MQPNINILPESQNEVKKERYGSLDGLKAYAALGILLIIKVKPSINYVTEHLIPFLPISHCCS